MLGQLRNVPIHALKQIFVQTTHQFTQFGKCPHDLNIDCYGMLAMQNCRKHSNTLLRKGKEKFSCSVPDLKRQNGISSLGIHLNQVES